MAGAPAWPLLLLLFLCIPFFSSRHVEGRRRVEADEGLCAELIGPLGYPCTEHTVETRDGYLLGVQRVSGRRGGIRISSGLPVFLQHGLFMGGDAWFENSVEESLGFVLADQGFDVWVGNVRGTHWSHGHKSLSVKEKDYWDWSWQDLSLVDLASMISYVYEKTNSKVFIVGHSQGTIMALAALTQKEVADMVEAAALLSPISYLGHISSRFVRRAVSMHLDQILSGMGVHQLNFRSDLGVQIMDSVCDGPMDCSNLLASITGINCCFNSSRIDFYLQYEPHPSSLKNLMHLFQMIRKGTFAKYDYGLWKNLKLYGSYRPPKFDLSKIPKSLPIWMAYGGNDALADLTDVEQTILELQSKPELLFLESYGHVDFILSVSANYDLYSHMIEFFKSVGGTVGKTSSL